MNADPADLSQGAPCAEARQVPCATHAHATPAARKDCALSPALGARPVRQARTTWIGSVGWLARRAAGPGTGRRPGGKARGVRRTQALRARMTLA